MNKEYRKWSKSLRINKWNNPELEYERLETYKLERKIRIRIFSLLKDYKLWAHDWWTESRRVFLSIYDEDSKVYKIERQEKIYVLHINETQFFFTTRVNKNSNIERTFFTKL